MNMRFWKSEPKPRQVQIVRRDSLKLRLAEWRADLRLVSGARQLMESEDFRCMIDVLRNENPANYVMPLGTSAQDRASNQCRAEGYTMALSNLEALSRPNSLVESVEATFEPEERNNQTA